MKIPFRKVKSDAVSFDTASNQIIFRGKLLLEKYPFVTMNARIDGILPQLCSSCGTTVEVRVDEEIELFISDGHYSGNDDYDIIEVLNSEIDTEEILQSELEMLSSDYHYCKKCINKLDIKKGK